MISHRCFPWGRDLSICHSQTSELKGHTMALCHGADDSRSYDHIYNRALSHRSL
jgi:hypothetical protein